MAHDQQVNASCGLGTTHDPSAWCHVEGVAAYQGRSHMDRGLRWRNDPLCCVLSWFVKKPMQIDGLRMVMTLA